MSQSTSKLVHVAVGILLDSQSRICIACRPSGKHLAGLWEFPGGKVDPGETVVDALAREFKEELDISVLGSEKFMDIKFEYPEKSVWLDVHLIKKFSGTARGMEQQQVEWVPISDLGQFEFPEANVTILEKIQQDLV